MTWQLSNRQATLGTTILMTIALLALVAMVAFSPHRLTYDEPYYLNYVSLLHQHGLTIAYIQSVPGPAGPLYGFVQRMAEPVTHLDPVGMRLVNISFLLGVMVVLGVYLRFLKKSTFFATPLLALVVPMTWVVSGLALTEAPALFFVTLSLCFQLKGLDAFQAERPVWGKFLVSGILLGVAFWGRQPYVLLAGVIVLLVFAERRLMVPAMIFLVALAAIVSPLVVIWHGLVPPAMQKIVGGLSLSHALDSLSYTGFCIFLLAPSFFRFSAVESIGVAVSAVVCHLFWGTQLYPLGTVVRRLISARMIPAYGQLCGWLFMCIGLFFLAAVLRALWRHRTDLKRIAVYSGLVCVALSPLFVAHQYSSRYTAMALPFLILTAEDWRRWATETLLLSGIGAALGFLSLFGYFYW